MFRRSNVNPADQLAHSEEIQASCFHKLCVELFSMLYVETEISLLIKWYEHFVLYQLCYKLVWKHENLICSVIYLLFSNKYSVDCLFPVLIDLASLKLVASVSENESRIIQFMGIWRHSDSESYMRIITMKTSEIIFLRNRDLYVKEYLVQLTILHH